MLQPGQQKRNIKERFTFWKGRTKRGISQPTREMSVSGALPSGNVYTSINDLPFSNYLECLINKNYAALNIDGSSIEDPEAAIIFNRLNTQVMELTVTPQGLHALKLFARIVSLESKINRIQTLIDALLTSYNPITIKDLQQSGFEYEFRVEHYRDDISRVVNRAKTYVVELSNTRKQYDAVKKGDGKPPAIEDYDRILASISELKKREIYADQITTLRYCNYYNDMIRHNNRQMKQARAK